MCYSTQIQNFSPTKHPLSMRLILVISVEKRCQKLLTTKRALNATPGPRTPAMYIFRVVFVLDDKYLWRINHGMYVYISRSALAKGACFRRK